MKYKIGDKVTLTDGNIMTIDQIYDISKWYIMKEDPWSCYTDEMIEGIAEDETEPDKVIEEAKTFWDSIKDAWICPEGYIFKDENGNVINTTKIVLDKKGNDYPKTYEECCKVLEIEGNSLLINTKHITDYERDLGNLMGRFHRLIICRDAYWKIAGEEMGLDKPWEPDFDNLSTNLEYIKIIKGCFTYSSRAFAFPTKEMRDAFKENFDKDLETCKELL